MQKTLQNLVVVILLFTTTNLLYAQQSAQVNKISGRGMINFTGLANKEKLNPPKLQKQRNMEEKEEKQRGIPVNLPVPSNAKVTAISPGFITPLQFEQPDINSPGPIKTFDGIIDDNTLIPPDVNGAAGPNHLFETLNSEYRIFNKSGGVVSTLTKSAFWSGLASFGVPFSDPHVVYDANAGRWYTCIIAELNNGHYGIFIAASLTSDPTGSWYEYSIDTGPSTTLPDYPLLGYTKDFVVITTNDFKYQLISYIFKRVRIVVLDRAAMAAGTLSTTNTFYDASGIYTLSPAETMDASQSSVYMLCNYNGNSGGNGYVQVCSVSGTPASPVYTAGAVIGVNQPWSETSIDAPQKGITSTINTNGTKMRSVIFRNGSLWATHNVYLPAAAPTHCGADFWQIAPSTNTVVQYGRLEDPTAKYWVAFSSIGVTSNNSMLLGATLFGKSIYASAVYAYRSGSDAPSTLRKPKLYKVGKASYFKDFGSGRNRWGDFSSTSIDPSDGTFWTLQEYATTPANTWGTVWANVGAPAEPPMASLESSELTKSEAVASVSPNPSKGNFVLNYTTKTEGNAVITVYNLKGDIVFTKKITVSEGANHVDINLLNALAGNYTIAVIKGPDANRIPLIISK